MRAQVLQVKNKTSLSVRPPRQCVTVGAALMPTFMLQHNVRGFFMPLEECMSISSARVLTRSTVFRE